MTDKKNGVEALWEYRVEIFSGALVLVGLILAFFYHAIGGVLVGLGFGVCFFEEMREYFERLRGAFTKHGLFKSLLLIGTILYFLIVIPYFLIAVAVGYGVMYLIRLVAKKEL